MQKSNEQGKVIVFTGPSGVGKGTIMKQALADDQNLVLSVSATTRLPRPGEVDGVHYHFICTDEFQTLIDEGQMLEWAEFADNMYGTFKAAVEEKTALGKDVILEIEVQGAMQVKEKLKDALLVFIAPPSLEELRHRLTGRATESQDVINKRLNIAEAELKMLDQFDYIVVNDNLEKAVEDFKAVIKEIRALERE